MAIFFVSQEWQFFSNASPSKSSTVSGVALCEDGSAPCVCRQSFSVDRNDRQASLNKYSMVLLTYNRSVSVLNAMSTTP